MSAYNLGYEGASLPQTAQPHVSVYIHPSPPTTTSTTEPVEATEAQTEGIVQVPERERATWRQRFVKVGIVVSCAAVGVIAQQTLIHENSEHEKIANGLLFAGCISAISPGISLIQDDVLGVAAFRRIAAGISLFASSALIDTYQGNNAVGRGFAAGCGIVGGVISAYPTIARFIRGDYPCPWAR